MKKILFAVLAALSTCVFAATNPYDGNWTRIIRQQDPGVTAYAEFEYDANSFQRNGAIVSYWQRLTLGDEKDRKKFVTVSQELINCETQQGAQTAFVSSLGSDDGTLQPPSEMLQKPPVYKSYPPNSPGAKVMRFMCKVRP